MATCSARPVGSARPAPVPFRLSNRRRVNGRARYRAEREVIAQRNARWEITGEPEVRRVEGGRVQPVAFRAQASFARSPQNKVHESRPLAGSTLRQLCVMVRDAATRALSRAMAALAISEDRSFCSCFRMNVKMS